MSTFEQKHVDALGKNRERLSEGVPEREEIRDLLLGLDDEIPPNPFPSTRVLGLNLYRHWSGEHRTALWFPNPHNNYRVNEIYLRYGKSQAEIRSFRDVIPPAVDEPPDLGGFPAHIHLAIGLCADGFFYQLVIGPKAWLDLNNFCEVLKGSEGTRIASALSSLDEDYVIWWGKTEATIRDFESPHEFAKLLQNPQAGAMAGRDYLVIRKNVSAVGSITVTTKSIENEIRRMYPVFNAVALRIPPA
jgi:hypothetical protein